MATSWPRADRCSAVGQPQDLDSVLMMLVANESHFINGAVIQADDGFAV